MLWVPHEHGAWAWLIVPVAAGALIGPAAPFQAVLLVCAVSGYFCFNALSWWVRMPPARRGAALRPAAVYGAVTVVAALALVVLTGPEILVWCVVLAVGPAIAWWYTRRGAGRGLASGLATALACSLLLLVAVRPDPFSPAPAPPAAVWATALTFGYLGGTVFSVKSLIRQRRSTGWLAASVGWHAAWTAVAGVGVGLGQPFAWFALWIVLTARAAALPLLSRRRPLRPAVIGAAEVVTSLALLGVAAWAGTIARG